MDPNQQRAFNLIFQTEFTQQQIADLLDIDRRTLYRWMKEGGWKRAKYAARHAPNVLIEQYYEQLGQINLKIAQRANRPYPSRDESEVIRRLTMTIKHIRNGRNTVSESVQVFQAFTDKMRNKDIPLLKQMVPHMDKHIKDLSQEGDLLNYSPHRLQEAAFDKEYEDWLATQVSVIVSPAEPTPPSSGPPLSDSRKEDGQGEVPQSNIIEFNPTIPANPIVPQNDITPPSPFGEGRGEVNGTLNGTSENPPTDPNPLPGNTSMENDNSDLPTKNNFQQDNPNPDPSPDNPDSKPTEPPAG
jgi:hypothetical protein